jgi:hypothetical protein
MLMHQDEFDLGDVVCGVCGEAFHG